MFSLIALLWLKLIGAKRCGHLGEKNVTLAHGIGVARQVVSKSTSCVGWTTHSSQLPSGSSQNKSLQMRRHSTNVMRVYSNKRLRIMFEKGKDCAAQKRSAM